MYSWFVVDRVTTICGIVNTASQVYLPASEVFRRLKLRDSLFSILTASALISSSGKALSADDTYLVHNTSGDTISLSTTDTLHTNSKGSPTLGLDVVLETFTIGLGRSDEREYNEGTIYI